MQVGDPISKTVSLKINGEKPGKAKKLIESSAFIKSTIIIGIN